MKVWFKRVLIGLAVIVVVGLLGLAAFLLTFDPNAYKSKVQEIVYERYHRTLSINGDIQLSLFPRIGLSVQNVQLSQRDSTDTFASLDSARFAVAIWPLLRDRLVVDHVSVTGFKAWVVRDSEGRFNFDDLLGGSASTQESLAFAPAGLLVKSAQAEPLPAGDATVEPSQSQAALQIDIAGLDLKGGEVHLVDAKSGYVARLEDVQLNTGRMTFDQPFDVSWRARLIGEYPQANAALEGQALVKMDPDRKAYSAQKLSFQLVGQVGSLDATTATLRGNFVYDGYSHLLDASGVELAVQGATTGLQPIADLAATLSLPKLKVDRSRLEFNLDRLALRATGKLPDRSFEVAFDAPRLSISPEAANGEPVSGTIKFSGDEVLGVSLGMKGLGGNAVNLTLKELHIESSHKAGDRLVQVNVSSPAQWDVFARRGSLSAMKGDVKISDAVLAPEGVVLPLIGTLHADLIKDEIASEINAVFNGSPINLNVKAQGLAQPKVVFAMKADALDYDKLFPAPASVPKQQTASAAPAPAADNASEQPPVQPQADDTPGRPELHDDTLDLSVLNTLDISGSINVGDLKMRELALQDVSLDVAAGEGKLKVSDISGALYGGKLSGDLTANADNQFTLKLNLDGVSAAPLTQALAKQDRLSGIGTLKLDLATQGGTPAALKSGLSGTARLQLREGAVRGIDLDQLLGQVANVLHTVLDGQGPDIAAGFDLGARTAFKTMDFNATLDKGVATVKKLALATNTLTVTQGSPATINLVGNTIDLVAKVRLVNPAGEDAKRLAGLKGVTVPVHILGPLDNPGYGILWKDMGGKLVRNAVQRGLLDLITDKAGGDTLELAPDIKGSEADSKPADPVKSLGNALKGLLGR